MATARQPLIVYILFHETNSGHSEESDGYIEAVFSTEAQAEAAKLAAIRKAIADDQAVYWNPDTEEEGDCWEHDWRVEAHQVDPIYCHLCNNSISDAQAKLSAARADGADPACQDCITAELTKKRESV